MYNNNYNFINSKVFVNKYIPSFECHDNGKIKYYEDLNFKFRNLDNFKNNNNNKFFMTLL